jgi:OOP family OmpA-OmpF porin
MVAGTKGHYMNHKKTIGILSSLGLMSCAMLMSSTVNAQQVQNDWRTSDWAKSAWYIGAGVGQSRASIDDQRLIRSLMNSGANSVQFTKDERDLGYKFFLGKQLNENFAIEGGYFNLGKSNFAANGNPGQLNGQVGLQGVNLDLLAQLPFTDQFSVYARLGAHYTEAKSHFTGNRLYALTSPNPTERNSNGKLGLGMEYKFTETLAMRAEVERYRINDGVQNRNNVDFYSLNLVYKMGRPAPVMRPTPPPEPTPVAPTPLVITETMPTPAPVVVKPVPVSEKINFSAEALFDFDKAVVKPDGKIALDQMLNSLQNMDTEVMVTVGHTDAIGSDTYNQALSIRRAEAVKAYLITRGIATERVYTEGQGERQAIADNSTSEGRAKNRRVIVEVVGTRR